MLTSGLSTPCLGLVIQPHPPAWRPLGPPPHGGSIPKHQGRGALLAGMGFQYRGSLAIQPHRPVPGAPHPLTPRLGGSRPPLGHNRGGSLPEASGGERILAGLAEWHADVYRLPTPCPGLVIQPHRPAPSPEALASGKGSAFGGNGISC